LRPVYYDEILSTRPPVDWFEIISGKLHDSGGRPLAMLERFRADYPIVMHGVSMSLASTDPLDLDYLKALKTLADSVEPAWVSDHLAWTGVHGRNLHDLLPIPYTREALNHVVERISRVQDILKRRLVVENASTYVTFTQSEMPEWEFVARMAERADCLLLLDVNNVFVSGFNHGFDIDAFIEAVPADRVAQFHMAGHTDNETHLIDTHDQPIREEVWTLYERARPAFRRCFRDDRARRQFSALSPNCLANSSACATSTPRSPPTRRGAPRELAELQSLFQAAVLTGDAEDGALLDVVAPPREADRPR